MNKTSPLLLVILDGWGVGPLNDSNAIHVANTPNLDRWQKEYPYTTLIAHNGAVGLPEGQMGNSEVGHLNIGAGRIVYQDYTRINMAVENGDFFQNEVLIHSFKNTLENNGALHLLGLVSDGGVHSHINHLTALVNMACRHGIHEIFIHAFMDGRDTPPKSGASYMEDLLQELKRLGAGKIATISGRYYAMDRDKRWNRVQTAWQAMVDGQGMPACNPLQAIKEAYGRGETDEFIKPIVMFDAAQKKAVATIKDGDTVLFFNFRADRVRQLTQAFTDQAFNEFTCDFRPALAECLTFTEYDRNFSLPVAFPPVTMNHILGEEISSHDLSQLRIAETEKYAHVTYFFNGGREKPFPLEDRILIPSPQEVATYDKKPEMSAYIVTEELIKRISEQEYALIVLNYANGDMVGHSGIMEAAVKACEAVDQCLGKLVAVFTDLGGTVMITADHGNAEIMKDPRSAGPFTAHSSNPVPFMLISNSQKETSLRNNGSLRDIAPTILDIMSLPVPEEMTGRSLINKELPINNK
jgi:2,3-bisphosphoglycerate-independent phosphoglycerate mutase